MYGTPTNDLKSFASLNSIDKIFWCAIKFRFLIACLILFFLFALSFFFVFSFTNILIILCFTLLLTPIDSFESYLNYINRYSLVFFLRLFSLFICTLIIIFLFISDSEPITYCWIFFVEYVFLLICYSCLIYQLIGFKNLVNFEYIKNYARTGFSIVFSGIAITFFIRSDQLILNYFFSANDVGLYSSVQRITDPFFIFPTLISLSFFTYLSKNKHLKNINNTFDFMYILCLQVIFLLFICIFFYGDSITTFLYGEGYSNTLLLLLLTLFIALHSFLIIYQTKCIIYGNFYQIPIIFTFAILIKLFFSYLFLNFGIINVAFANIFTSLLLIFFVLYFFENRKFLEFISTIMKNLFNPFLFKKIF